MRVPVPQNSDFVRRFSLVGLMALLLTLPFAVPAIWDVLRTHMGGAPGTFVYLVKPVENQYWYLLIAAAAIMIPVVSISLSQGRASAFRIAPITGWILLLFAAQLIGDFEQQRAGRGTVVRTDE